MKLAAFAMITAWLPGVIAFVFMLLAPDGTGGKGGDAKVGGNGVAVGGPGGHGGKYGHGGAGGSGEVKGDGVAAGGAGGSAGDDGVWRDSLSIQY